MARRSPAVEVPAQRGSATASATSKGPSRGPPELDPMPPGHRMSPIYQQRRRETDVCPSEETATCRRVVTAEPTLMADALAEIDALSSRAETDLKAVKNPSELEQFRIRYLGT